MTLYCDLLEAIDIRSYPAVAWDIYEKGENLNTVSYLTRVIQWYHSYTDIFGILDYVIGWIPFVPVRVTLFLQDITASVLLNETIATLYTGGLTASMYLKDIALSIYGKLSQR